MRLETIAPDLSARLDGAAPEACRRAALVAAAAAAQEAGLKRPALDVLLAAVEAGRVGNTPERSAVRQLVDELDDAQ